MEFELIVGKKYRDKNTKEIVEIYYYNNEWFLATENFIYDIRQFNRNDFEEINE